MGTKIIDKQKEAGINLHNELEYSVLFGKDKKTVK